MSRVSNISKHDQKETIYLSDVDASDKNLNKLLWKRKELKLEE